MNSFKVINRLSPKNEVELLRLYQKEWWTKGRRSIHVKRILQGSDIVLGLIDTRSKRLAAFARVLTDFVCKGFIFDLIVAKEYRRKGLGKHLLEVILRHPKLRPVQHLELYCRPDIVPFYKKFRFSEKLGPLFLMRRINRPNMALQPTLSTHKAGGRRG